MAGGRPKKKHKFISPAGEVFEFFGLADFCKERGLSPSHMSDISRGRGRVHKGWTACQDSTECDFKYIKIDNDSFAMAKNAAKRNDLTTEQYISDIIELCAGGYLDLSDHNLN